MHGHLSGKPDHDAVLALYQGLLSISPTLGIRVGHAAALAERDGPRAGLEALDAVPGEDFQPWWAVRADLLAKLGESAADAYATAISLCKDRGVREWLQLQAETASR